MVVVNFLFYFSNSISWIFEAWENVPTKNKKNEIDKTTQNGCCDFCGRFKSQEEKK
jgi:hypothetical protein